MEEGNGNLWISELAFATLGKGGGKREIKGKRESAHKGNGKREEMEKTHHAAIWRIFLSTGIAVILLDQLTKYWAASLTAPIPLTSFLLLRLSTNTGAAFSTFTAYPKLLTLITAAAVIGIPLLVKKVQEERMPLGLIWGGATGNLIDRLTLGAVRDFISFSFWPSFNVADAAITIGVIVLLWQEWRKHA